MLLHSHTESAQYLPLASEFLVARRFLPTASGDFLAARRFLPPDCPSWVLCACSCIHTHNQRTLYHWHPNSWWPDASCRRAAHRGCRALAPAFTHRISAIFTGGIRIPGGQTLPAAGLTIVGAGRLNQRFHTQNQRNQRNLYCWHPYVRVRASIFHPRKKIGLSPRRPCGSDEPCPRFARSPGAALGCSTSPLHDPACCFAFLVRPWFLATTNI